ncbi:M48 family metallopeptidase [Brevundimonas diminuta]|uniref:M48 family metallopeptidase n=1 Tax=Brevundimonas diminuta TaxID=293 RepID=UPI003CFC8EDA
MSRKPVLAALAIAAGIISAGAGGCAYNEALGRNQLVFIDDGMLIQQSQAAWAETLRTQKVSNNAAQNARVRRVGDRIVQAANLTNRHWEYAVFDDSTPNAFVLPSGHMGVTTGLLAMAKNDDQLAAVIGHEVGHVVARHAAERASTTQTTGLILGAVQSQAGDYGQAVQAFGGMGAQLGILLPFSRSHELEADRLGVDYMVAAGYKASESLNLWRAMAEGRQSGTPEFASTHPSDQTRLMQLQQYIASRGWN